jgi:dihydroxy-acid dehydratase
MPEVGNMSVPKKLLEQGVHDMVRISDGRMSGTGFGTVVLHVSPESAMGGTLALVQNGDWIELDTAKRRLRLLVDEAILEERRKNWKPAHKVERRGYVQLYQQHVQQAHLGADMDFCVGGSGSVVTRDSH